MRWDRLGGKVKKRDWKKGRRGEVEGKEEEGFHPYNFPPPSPFFKLLPRVKTGLQKQKLKYSKIDQDSRKK